LITFKEGNGSILGDMKIYWSITQFPELEGISRADKYHLAARYYRTAHRYLQTWIAFVVYAGVFFLAMNFSRVPIIQSLSQPAIILNRLFLLFLSFFILDAARLNILRPRIVREIQFWKEEGWL